MKISRWLGIRILIVLAAIALTAVRIPSSWVENYYSGGLYPHLAGFLKPITVHSPVPILDCLLILLAVGLPAWWWQRIRAAGAGKKWAAAGRTAFETVTLAAVLVCVFEVLWGLNYQRLPLSTKLDWDGKRVTPASALALARANIGQLNAVATDARGRELPPKWQADLERSFREVAVDLGGPADFQGVSPRSSLIRPLLAAEGCEGFINPFGYEVILDDEVLAFEKPFLLAHEWAHLAGFADEGEANFVAILACLRSDVPVLRYSGRLNLSFYLPRRSPPKTEALPELSTQVVADINAIRRRMERHYQPVVANVQAQIYHHFLKANRVEAGIGSYGLVARLMVGARFETNWRPVMRGRNEVPASPAIAGD